MILLEDDISDSQVISLIREMVDLLAKQEYEAVYEAVGYSMAGTAASAEWIECDIRRYRSEFYPNISEFVVSDWRLAEGGNPNPKSKVIRYEQNSTGLRGAAEYDLPLNGSWSDLCADFTLFGQASKPGLILMLEEIRR